MNIFQRIPEKVIYVWIINPFESNNIYVEKDCTNLPIDLANELADLSSDSGLKLKWSQTPVPEFWIYCTNDYPRLSTVAIKFLLPFTTTYLCESGFSVVTATKTKERNRLKANLSSALRVGLSRMTPRIDSLVSAKQAHVSH